MDKYYTAPQQEHQQNEMPDTQLIQGLQSFLHSQTGQSLLSTNANIQHILQNALFKQQQPTVINQHMQVSPSPQGISVISEKDTVESLRNKDVSIVRSFTNSKFSSLFRIFY